MVLGSTLAVLLLSACLSAMVIHLLRPRARRLGLIDEPDHRKQHGETVPLVGGIGIFIAYMGTAFAVGGDLVQYLAFGCAAAALVVVGILDDKLELSPRKRLLVQAGAALVFVLGAGVALRDLGDLFGKGPIELGYLVSLAFTVFCVVGLINAFNMADGVDGLAGGLGVSSAVMFAAAAGFLGLVTEQRMVLAFAGAVLGFLVFNLKYHWRPYRVFMGDAGSMFVGLALVWYAIILTQRPEGGLYPISAVWILGLPILDTVATMLRRIAAGRSPFHPDRTHLHHLLMSLGFTPATTVAIIIGSSLALGFVGLLGWRMGVSEAVLATGFLCAAFVYLAAISTAWNTAARTHLGSITTHVDPGSAAANQVHTARPGTAAPRARSSRT